MRIGARLARIMVAVFNSRAELLFRSGMSATVVTLGRWALVVILGTWAPNAGVQQLEVGLAMLPKVGQVAGGPPAKNLALKLGRTNLPEGTRLP